MDENILAGSIENFGPEEHTDPKEWVTETSKK